METSVLCVGDRSFTGEVRSILSEQLPVGVAAERSLDAARSALESGSFDCVVTSESLPEATGLTVVDRFQSIASETPIVVWPSDGTEELAVRVMRADGFDYISSSAEDREDRLLARVEAALDQQPVFFDEQPIASDLDVRLRSFKRAVEQAGHSIYITDPDGTIRYVNPAFEEMTGYTAEEAVGRTPNILSSGLHDEGFYRDLWGTILDGEVWQSEMFNTRKDGSQYVVNQTISPISVDGETRRFVVVNADITDRIQWETRLETLHDATRSWLDITSIDEVTEAACTQLDALLDIDAVCIYCHNDGRLEPRTWTADGKTPAGETGAPDVITPIDDHRWGAFEDSETRRIDSDDGSVELLLPVGEYGMARITAAGPNAFDDSDITIGLVFAANLEAVLGRLVNHRELERQNERLDEFAGIVSHDLQNPLSVAMGHLELLEDALESTPAESDLAAGGTVTITAEDSTISSDLQRVRDALERMERIIDDLLTLASEGEQACEPEQVSLEECAQWSWSLVETTDASLHIESDCRFEADPGRLYQLLENLFGNAVTHTEGTVEVRVGALTDSDGFYVADDGPGIPPAERGEVFTLGYSKSEGGTGFGLAIVERIADGHGWSVDIEESDAGGARFVIRT